MNKLHVLAYVLLAYGLGSLSGSILLARILGYEDIRKHGSGATGMTNALRTHGLAFGASTFIIDAFKGILVALLAKYLGYGWAVFLGLAVVLGHDYPVFAGFKGGKGIATSFGFLLVYDPTFIGLGALAFALALALTRTVSIGSLAASGLAVLYGLVQALRGERSLGLTLLLLGLLAIWRHRSNIGRIIRGEEKPLKLGGGKNFRKKERK